MFRRVAIIGGGAAGASLLSELAGRRTDGPLHLDWYVGRGTPGRGVAYATDSPRHLLDVRAASMSMFAHRPNGFLDYARRSDPAIAGTAFLPRRLYGDYLEEEVARTLAQAGTYGHDIHMVPATVDAAVPERDGVSVLHGDTESRVEAAVLALGALPPQPLPGVSVAARDSGRYVVDPWPFLAAPFDGPPPRRVALVGSGLTAMDVLLELSARWPEAEFTAVSPHGRPPESHLAKLGLPPDDGDELVAAMRDAPGARAWLRLVREACRQHRDWRAVIDSLRPYTPSLWMELPGEERARFLRHLRGYWERARHRMPPQAHEAVAALERDGRLRYLRGRLRAADTAADGSLRLDIGQPAALAAELAIQATGLDTDAARSPHPLVRQLLTNGHVQADPLGLGLQAEPDGRLRHHGEAWPTLFAIGSLLRGTLWESTAMPEIRQHARLLADRLLGR